MSSLEGSPTQDFGVSFRSRGATSTVSPDLEKTPSERWISAPRHLDFNRVDTTSTYAALSSCLVLLREAGRRQSDFVSRAELDLMIHEFEWRKVDLSDVTGFPYEADDLSDVVLLLARIQNRMAMRGMKYTCYMLRDILQDTLIDRSNKNHRYNIGEWIEVRGPSMKYRLERIEDVIRTNNEGGEGALFMYETSVDHRLTEPQIRWPRESLRRIFGMGPWVWRQWACMKLEKKLQCRKGSPNDFELLNILSYAAELWELWLADERNASFKELFERVGTSGQEELIHHIMAPFDLMHQVVTNANGNWDLSSAEISMFTYMSLLGTRFLDAFIVFILQCCIPIVLFFYYTNSRDNEEIAVGTREMLVIVLFYYVYKLNFDLWSNFNQVVGLSGDTSSRIRSLRKITWDEGNDTFLQSLGYTIDLFMNTGYVCLLCMFNIWILYNVMDPFELFGSVIFFEFLFDLDEEIARASWWDKDWRLLKAGILSVILQNTIRRGMLVDRDTFLSKIGGTMTPDELNILKGRLDEAGVPKDGTFLNGSESEEGHLLTVAERIDRLRKIESQATLSQEHQEESVESGGLMFFFRNYSNRNVFERHDDIRAWSQWEILLFSFPTPSMVPSNYIKGSKLTVPDDVAELNAFKRIRKYAPGKRYRELIFQHAMESLTCAYTRRNLRSGSEKDTNWFPLTRILHGVALWTSFALQLSFPFISVAAVAFVFSDFYCVLHLGPCNFAEPYFLDMGAEDDL